jgi:large subunit ribosomal protein L5e
MGFVKVQKNKAYYKRLQTKYRRRREGKTDYHARRKMVAQDKNKYNTPKFRLIARITNKRIICQIAYATIQGDRMLCQADSKELANYGVPTGHTNYAACYATGLLIARRALDLVGLADSISGMEECNAEEVHVEDEDNERTPFKVILDVGLIRTIPGSRVFGILKGAVDGGLHIPHSVKKFPGFKEPEERGQDYEYDAPAHLERILGNHLSEYMEMLQEEDPERYKVAFSSFIENDIEADGVEDMYKECHSKIREDPKFTKKENSGITNKRTGNKITTSNGTSYTRMIKLSKEQRKARVAQKLATVRAKLLAAAAGDEEEEEE